MNSIYLAPMYATINGGQSAIDLIDNSEIIMTLSGDYCLRSGNYDLNLTDNGELAVSEFGETICRMELSSIDASRIERVQEEIEKRYSKAQ